MKKYKKLMAVLLGGILAFSLTACNKESTNNDNSLSKDNNEVISDKDTKGEKNQGGNGRGGSVVDKSNDEELQSILSEVVSKYQQLEFKDEETGKTLAYNLYVPENYDESKSYPLVLFMPDSSLSGKEGTASLTQGYGGVIWATSEEQAKHESFVLVPQYSEQIVNDNFETTDEVDMTVRLLNSIVDSYSIDTNRLYTTGQSMGCMTSMYLNLAYPDLFAASLYVGGQWDTSKMDVLGNTKFFYIVGEGDTKASVGMKDLETVFENAGVSFSTAIWDAKWSEEELNSATEEILKEGNNANLVMFKLGSVLPEGVEVGGNEHMYSFDYAYKIEAVRDWLFQQVKE